MGATQDFLTMQERKDAPEIRCGQCDRLLAKGEAVNLAIKCPRCGTINQITKSGKTAKP
jgi:phage FluMu protein Com